MTSKLITLRSHPSSKRKEVLLYAQGESCLKSYREHQNEAGPMIFRVRLSSGSPVTSPNPPSLHPTAFISSFFPTPYSNSTRCAKSKTLPQAFPSG